MMADTYSTYEAKAKFSEILRKVRAEQRVVIAYRGEEVAEIRPLEVGNKGFAGSLKREGVEGYPGHLVSWLTWIYPDRPLRAEFDRITPLGYLRGADLWHVANALFVDPTAGDLTFRTLDARQRDVAARLGFAT